MTVRRRRSAAWRAMAPTIDISSIIKYECRCTGHSASGSSSGWPILTTLPFAQVAFLYAYTTAVSPRP